MDLILYRQQPTPHSIPGEIFIDGKHAAYTLERPGVAILAGTYRITLYPSPHFGRLMPLLNDVPTREDILIHWGNYPTNSDGCILVGKQRDVNSEEIFNTREMFDALFPAIQSAVEAEGCWITVNDPAGSDVVQVQRAAVGED